MSRSNKEARCRGGGLSHSGMTVKTGHGGMKRNKTMGMAAGQDIKPKDEESSGMARAKARQAKGKAATPAAGASSKPMSTEGKSGWDKIGQAGADITTEYMKRRKAKKSE